VQVTRSWLVDDGKLVLRFVLHNQSAGPVQAGALGIPMIFNNVLHDRTLEQVHALCSFYDPYIGKDAGYLQVTRLNGHSPALLVVPDGTTPLGADSPILGDSKSNGAIEMFHDPTPRVSRDLAGQLLEDLHLAIQYFRKNPSSQTATRQSAVGYHHN